MNLKEQTKFSILSNDKTYHGYSITKAANLFDIDISRLPYSIRILAENILRNLDNPYTTVNDFKKVLDWNRQQIEHNEVPFMPARVIMHDLAGVVALVDFSAMRNQALKQNLEPKKINPLVPTDVIIDHSVQVEHTQSAQALSLNIAKEVQMNEERFSLLKWGAAEFDNFKLIPPGKGIIHQINLEYLAKGINFSTENDETTLFPDSLIGTDSHTTMINGAGVFGWGVGGIEGESVMLGQPYIIRLPQVIGVELTGNIGNTVTTTDIALYITNRLRQHGVVGCYVEFFGEGVDKLSVQNRATIANMAPEYGATMGYFPIDAKTMEYFKQTNRSKHTELAEHYLRKQRLFKDSSSITPHYADIVTIDLSSIGSILAGPKRPQDKVRLRDLKNNFRNSLDTRVPLQDIPAKSSKQIASIEHGDIVIAAITSCTNTSNPDLLIGAGILAKKLVDRGLQVNKNIKTSFTPGSRVVQSYLSNSGLLPYLEQLGFNIVAYGCATCAGNSGSLDSEIAEQIIAKNIVATAITSANRNFEGRVHPLVKSHYITSPILVVALAVFGSVLFDTEHDPLGHDENGKPVYLKDVWPIQDEIETVKSQHLNAFLYSKSYSDVFTDTGSWRNIPAHIGEVYGFSDSSSYIKCPNYFNHDTNNDINQIVNARALLKLGDSITTDHISPVAAIDELSAAGQYLLANGVPSHEFNSYGSRRGNHEVMVRGTFANIRIKNLLVPGKLGGYSIHHPSGSIDSVHATAEKYSKENTPLIVIAGKEYGTGSCRDWAAKGTALLGIKVILAESFERIHRANLVAMGVYPISFTNNDSAQSLGLLGDEAFTFTQDRLDKSRIFVSATNSNHVIRFQAKLCAETELEFKYLSNGGLIPTIFKNIYHEGVE